MIPDFHYKGVILSSDQLRYAPHPDIIHPSVIDTSPLASEQLGRYYMYYAPHDAPGGICLAFADDPEGPWQEHGANPVIPCNWPPHHSVSHVSSPHAVWNQEEEQLFLYYHGENDVTRYAVSPDGIHFEHGGVALSAAMLGAGVSEASYARVFPMRRRDTQGGYVMLLMGNDHGTRKIFLAWSVDGRRWDPVARPFATPPQGTDQMGPGSLLEWDQQLYLICFANREDSPTYDPISDLYLFRVDPSFESATCIGLLMAHDAAGGDNARLNDPCLLATPERLYLFVNVGRRLQQAIGLAVADLCPSEGGILPQAMTAIQ